MYKTVQLNNRVGGLYLICMLVFLAFDLYVAFGKYGKIRLGGEDSRPEYKNLTWFGLLFGCGMGVGLVFYGVAEPLTHYLHPVGIEAATPKAADFAFRSFFMHWGILSWANYAVIGLALAYFMFRKDKKGLISNILTPVVGEERAGGWFGKVVDILAVFATVAGVVTSLGLGTLQIEAGFHKLFGLPTGLIVEIAIIIVVSVIYIGSAVSGLEKGITFISDTNIYVAIGLLAACFVLGPKVEILDSFINGLGQYIGNFIQDSLSVSSYGDNSWLGSWNTGHGLLPGLRLSAYLSHVFLRGAQSVNLFSVLYWCRRSHPVYGGLCSEVLGLTWLKKESLLLKH